MTRRTVEHTRCDRCGDESSSEASPRERGEGSRFLLGDADGSDVLIGSFEHPADLCPSCTFELKHWMGGARLAAEADAKEPA